MPLLLILRRLGPQGFRAGQVLGLDEGAFHTVRFDDGVTERMSLPMEWVRSAI
jgi:hypothetical protein